MVSLSSERLSAYLSQVRAFPLLDREAELALARKFRNEGDRTAAQALVTNNLRFVVKVARQYQNYGIKLEDLIQEGNIGLMKAVEKFDPAKGYRLITYAVWWIRAYIHNLILRSWSLVKMGTTQAQRRLFYQLSRAKRRIAGMSEMSSAERHRVLADKLDASEDEIREMERRTAGRDVTLDAPIGDESDTTFLDLVPGHEANAEQVIGDNEEREVLRNAVSELARNLKPRERYILKNRVLAEEPECLREIGARFNVSRERVRQLETILIQRLRETMSAEFEPSLRV